MQAVDAAVSQDNADVLRLSAHALKGALLPLMHKPPRTQPFAWNNFGQEQDLTAAKSELANLKDRVNQFTAAARAKLKELGAD